MLIKSQEDYSKYPPLHPNPRVECAFKEREKKAHWKDSWLSHEEQEAILTSERERLENPLIEYLNSNDEVKYTIIDIQAKYNEQFAQERAEIKIREAHKVAYFQRLFDINKEQMRVKYELEYFLREALKE